MEDKPPVDGELTILAIAVGFVVVKAIVILATLAGIAGLFLFVSV